MLKILLLEIYLFFAMNKQGKNLILMKLLAVFSNFWFSLAIFSPDVTYMDTVKCTRKISILHFLGSPFTIPLHATCNFLSQ